MRALLVVNPKATTTSARARDVLAQALSSATRLEVAETKARGHGTELARSAVADGFDVVVALGGDGTVNEVVNGLLEGGPREGLPALGVVPAGSTNVFARALGLPDEPVEATALLLDALRGEQRRSIGLGRAGDRWFTFNAGLGLDAEVVRRVDGRRAQGRRATPGLYVRAALQQFFLATDRREPHLVLERAGTEPQRVGLALVCNAAPWTYMGTRPVHTCPQASFDAGLDVFALRTLGTVSTLRHARQILSAQPRLRGRSLLALHDLPQVVLRADVPTPLQLDGEDLGDHTVVELTSVPHALEVVVAP